MLCSTVHQHIALSLSGKRGNISKATKTKTSVAATAKLLFAGLVMLTAAAIPCAGEFFLCDLESRIVQTAANAFP